MRQRANFPDDRTTALVCRDPRALRADTHPVDILEQNHDPSFGHRLIRPMVWCLFLVACALVGSGIAEYRKLLPVAQERDLPTSILLEESFRQFDLGFAIIGVLIGIAILATPEWVRRRSSAD